MSINYFTIKALNTDLLIDKVKGFLTADAATASGTLTVESITGVSIGDYLLLGEFGNEGSEIVRVHTATAPTGSTITLNANTTKPHIRGEAFYLVDRDQVEFSRSTTLTGSKSTLTTVSINTDGLYTVYEDTTNTTGYGWYRFKNSADTTYSNYSESWPYAGYSEQSLKEIFDSVLLDLGMVDEFGQPQFAGIISRNAALKAVKDAQEELAKSRNRWSFLQNFDSNISEIGTGEDAYALPAKVAYENRRAMIQAVRIGSGEKLKYIDKNKFNEYREGVVKTTLATTISSTSTTSMVLTDSSDFPDSGTGYIIPDDQDSVDTFTFTANNRATNTLTVSGLDDTYTAGVNVWYGATFGKPLRYTVFEDYIYLDPIPDEDYEDYNLLADLYERPTVVDDPADEVQFPAFAIKPYVAWKLSLLKNNGVASDVDSWRQIFDLRKTDLMDNENNGQSFKLTPGRVPEKTTNLLWDINDFSDDDNN